MKIWGVRGEGPTQGQVLVNGRDRRLSFTGFLSQRFVLALLTQLFCWLVSMSWGNSKNSNHIPAGNSKRNGGELSSNHFDGLRWLLSLECKLFSAARREADSPQPQRRTSNQPPKARHQGYSDSRSLP